jgi:AraC-like DNA-binding protein
MRRSVAVELPENTHLRIEQIAERIGFADSVSFRKAFKKWTRRSPTDFRAHNPRP